MSEERQRIAECLVEFLGSQGGDCRAADDLVGDKTVADLLDEYDAAAEGEAGASEGD
jgi:hypothetical protein